MHPCIPCTRYTICTRCIPCTMCTRCTQCTRCTRYTRYTISTRCIPCTRCTRYTKFTRCTCYARCNLSTQCTTCTRYTLCARCCAFIRARVCFADVTGVHVFPLSLLECSNLSGGVTGSKGTTHVAIDSVLGACRALCRCSPLFAQRRSTVCCECRYLLTIELSPDDVVKNLSLNWPRVYGPNGCSA